MISPFGEIRSGPGQCRHTDQGLTTTNRELFIMAINHGIESPPARQTPGDLSALAERLVQGNVRNPAAKAMADDMREAASVLAEWRVGIEEVSQRTKDDDARAQKLTGGA
jgi:hypothetical protein